MRNDTHTPTKQRPPGTSLRLAAPVSQLWSDLAAKMNLSKTAVLTIALQDLAERKGVPIPSEVRRDDGTA